MPSFWDKINRRFRYFTYFLPFLLLGHPSHAQNLITETEISFEKFDLPKGYLGNSVQCIVQDSFGFMWFASKNGLHRWDGYQFKTYQHDPGDTTSIAGNYVEYIYLAKDGSLWLSVNDNSENVLLDHFNYKTETFRHYDYPPNLSIKKEAYSIAAIVEDTAGNLWLGTHYGVYRLNPKTGIFKQYLNDPDNPSSLSHNICRSICRDASGDLWFGTGLFWDQSTEGGLNRYRPETDDFERYFHKPNDPNSLKSNIITEIFEDSKKDLWIGTTKSGLHKMNRQDGTFQRFFDEMITANSSTKNTFNPSVQSIYEDQKNKFWISYYYQGLAYYDPVSGLVKLLKANKNNIEGLPENNVWSLYQSRDKTLWGSTTGPESVVFKIKQKNYNQYILESSTNFVGSFYESRDKKLWVPTYEKGLSKLDIQTGEKEFFEPQKITLTNTNLDIEKSPLNKITALHEVKKIVEDRLGGLWMTKALFNGLLHFNPNNSELTAYIYHPGDEGSLGQGDVSDILKDKQGRIWVVTSKGDLNLYENGRFIKFNYTSLTSEELGLGYYCQLKQSKNGRIWIVGTGIKQNQLPPLVLQFDLELKEFKKVNLKLSKDELFVLDKEIRQLEEDNEGNIWICTPTHLITVSPTSGEINFHHANQFGTGILKGMKMDKMNQLWVVGESISFFDPLADSLLVRIVSDNPIKNFPHYKQPIYRNSSGQIFLGGAGSFLTIHPELAQQNYQDTPPETIITSFQLLDRTGDNQNGTAFHAPINSNIFLDHDQNTFSIRFATLAFQEPHRNRIMYKLNGFDEQWRIAGLEPIATYIKVPPGDYTFQVKGATANSDWGGIQELSIHISKPLWATWWAYALYGLLGIWLLFSINKFQLNRKLEKAEALRLKDLDTAKNRLFANISHEFRTPLTVISGMASHIKQSPEKWLGEGITIIERNCTRLLDLVKQMLDLSKLESGKLELQLIQSDIIPFVKYLCESFHSLSEESEVQLTAYAEVEELVMDFDPQKMSTIVINLLSNAIKFSPTGGTIIVHLNALEKGGTSYFSLKVKDNGPGIAKDDIEHIFDRFYQVDNSSTRTVEGTGIGLALTKELVELMDGTIEVHSTLGKGSEFRVQIPIVKNAPITSDVFLPERPEYLINSKQQEESLDKADLPLVLIIEDNEDVAKYLRICLDEKYSMLFARNGIEGIDIACEKIPDLVITDVMMPGKDGYEVCSHLKNDERTDHIPIIMLTAKASLQDRLSGLSHGADAYLIKPFNQAELFTRIEQLLSLREKMRKKVQHDPYSLILQKQVEGAEADFLKKAIELIHSQIGDHAFGSAQLAHKLHLSESQVYRKLKAITGKSTAVFIRSVRLQKAKEIILTGNVAISGVAYDVGFNDPSWFSRAFKEEFGYAPSELSK